MSLVGYVSTIVCLLCFFISVMYCTHWQINDDDDDDYDARLVLCCVEADSRGAGHTSAAGAGDGGQAWSSAVALGRWSQAAAPDQRQASGDGGSGTTPAGLHVRRLTAVVQPPPANAPSS